jgi:hypothetical protein
MNPDQEAVSNAFGWVNAVYREAERLGTEVAEQMKDARFDPWGKAEYASGKYTKYLYAQFFSKPAEVEQGQDIFVAMSFYPDPRIRRGHGARLLAGTLRRQAEKVSGGMTVVNVAARAPGEGGVFRVVSAPGDLVVVCDPAELPRELVWVGRVESFDLPLTSVQSPETVAELVGVVVALRDGDSAPARELLGRIPG